MDLNIGADDIYPFLATVFTDGSGHYQQDNALCDTVKNVQKQFEEHDRDFELSCRLTSTWPDLQIPKISIRSGICGFCWKNKSDLWKPQLATYSYT